MNTNREPRFRVQEVQAPSGLMYSVWDSLPAEPVELHNTRSDAQRRCNELLNTAATPGKKAPRKALRWWVVTGIRMRHVMRETRLIYGPDEMHRAVERSTGIGQGERLERILNLLGDWAHCMEGMMCAMHYLCTDDPTTRPGRQRPAHDLKCQWANISEKIKAKGDWQELENEHDGWVKAWNSLQGVPAEQQVDSTLSETIDRHANDYNDIRYFAEQDEEESGHENFCARYGAAEVIAMLVLDQYLLQRLNRFLLRNSAMEIDTPLLRLRCPATHTIHRLDPDNKRFAGACRAILGALLRGALIETPLWNQLWDRHTPQDYWRYIKPGEGKNP